MNKNIAENPTDSSLSSRNNIHSAETNSVTSSLSSISPRIATTTSNLSYSIPRSAASSMNRIPSSATSSHTTTTDSSVGNTNLPNTTHLPPSLSTNTNE